MANDQTATLENKSSLISDRWQQRHYDELRKFLTAKLKSKDDAADIAHDAYVRLLSVRNPEGICHPRAFFFKTALNLIVDKLRHPRRRIPHLTDEAIINSILSSSPSLDSVIEGRERLRLLQEAITELPPKCRQVFLLHKFNHLTHNEIAARLGISKNMVEKHVIKAMTHCRKRLDELT